jgi:hypothetical protein
MIVVALYFALGLGSGKLEPARWRFFIFGLAAGLVPTLDLPGSRFVARLTVRPRSFTSIPKE